MLWSLLSEIESFMSDSQHEEEVKPRGDKTSSQVLTVLELGFLFLTVAQGLEN